MSVIDEGHQRRNRHHPHGLPPVRGGGGPRHSAQPTWPTATSDGTVSVIDEGHPRRDRHHPRGLLPVPGWRWTPPPRTVYVANDSYGTVSVIYAATRAVTATIPVGTDPQGVAVDPAAGTPST